MSPLPDASPPSGGTEASDVPRHHRRSIRLQGYDYADAGAYFVTLCAHRSDSPFGEIRDGEMVPNAVGEIVQQCWQAIPAHHLDVELDAFVVMPDHIHGIIVIIEPAAAAHMVGATSGVGATYMSPLPSPRPSGPRPRSVGVIVGTFKAAVTRAVNATHPGDRESLWQRNYYEHIIRNEVELNRIRQYIEANPGRWYEAHEDDPSAAWRP